MSPVDVLVLGNQLVAPLGMIVGLWIASRWLPNVNSWLSSVGARIPRLSI